MKLTYEAGTAVLELEPEEVELVTTLADLLTGDTCNTAIEGVLRLALFGGLDRILDEADEEVGEDGADLDPPATHGRQS